MDKNAKELIQKLAGKNSRVQLQAAAQSQALGPRDPQKRWAQFRQGARDAGSGNIAGGKDPKFGKTLAEGAKSRLDEMGEKKSSMKNIIDDLIKGAQHNTFGRPVSIQQGSDPTPLDLAKFAGQLQALGEQGYSVKQAAEYLGLTERQVQDIVATVR